jgi:tRNA-dihydrouridine synthase B
MRTGWCARARNAPVLARAAEAPACRCSPCTAAPASRATKAKPNTTRWPPSRPRAHSGGGQRRHRQPRKGARRAGRTGCDAVMIGRAAQGRPWLFREVAHFLATGEHCRRPPLAPNCANGCWTTCKTTTPCTANTPACAPPASTWAGTPVRCRATRRAAALFREHINRSDELRQTQLQCVRDVFPDPPPPTNPGPWPHEHPHHLSDCVRASMEAYFRDLDGTDPHPHARHADQSRGKTAARSGHGQVPSTTSRAPPSGWA